MILCKTGAKIEDTKHNIPQVPSNKISDLTKRLATDSAGPNRSEPDGPEPNQTKKRYIDRMGVRVGGGALLWSVRPKARHFASVGEFHISRQDHQGGRNMGVATWGAHGREGAGRAGVRLALLGTCWGLLPNEAGCFASREIMDAVTLGYLGMGRGGGGSRGQDRSGPNLDQPQLSTGRRPGAVQAVQINC